MKKKTSVVGVTLNQSVSYKKRNNKKSHLSEGFIELCWCACHSAMNVKYPYMSFNVAHAHNIHCSGKEYPVYTIFYNIIFL